MEEHHRQRDGQLQIAAGLEAIQQSQRLPGVAAHPRREGLPEQRGGLLALLQHEGVALAGRRVEPSAPDAVVHDRLEFLRHHSLTHSLLLSDDQKLINLINQSR